MTHKALVLLMAGLLGWAVSLFAQEQSGLDNRHALRVSLIQVIANPKEFDGQYVAIIGYLGNNGLDRSVGVYVSEVDGRNFVIANSVDLHLEYSLAKNVTGKYVAFSGVYHAPPPRSGYNGYIDHILVMKPWVAGHDTK